MAEVTFRVQIYGTQYGQMTCTTLGFNIDGATQSMMGTLATLMDTDFLQNCIRGNVDASWAWNRIHVTAPGSTWAPVDLGINRAGALGPSSNMYPFVCAVIQFFTVITGKRGRGRIYLAGFGNQAAINGLWAPASMTRLNFIANAIKTKYCDPSSGVYNSLGAHLAIGPRADSSDGLLVTDVKARPLCGVQRRRNIGVGA